MSIIRNASGVPKNYRGFLWSKIMDAMVGSSVAQGYTLYRGASLWSGLAPGTSGRVLKTLGAGADPVWSTVPSSSGGAMTFMGETVIAGAAATTISVSGLDLNTDGCYLMQYAISNGAGTSDISLYYNADTTGANYDRQYWGINNTSSGGSGANESKFVLSLSSSQACTGFHLININFDAKVSSVGLVNITTSAVRAIAFSAITWRTASTNVTGITLGGSVANTMAIGSRMRVWRIAA